MKLRDFLFISIMLAVVGVMVVLFGDSNSMVPAIVILMIISSAGMITSLLDDFRVDNCKCHSTKKRKRNYTKKFKV
jgi:uncharacterized membrane protein (DUF106 family)